MSHDREFVAVLGAAWVVCSGLDVKMLYQLFDAQISIPLPLRRDLSRLF